MASNDARRKPANVDAPFARVSLDWVSQWQEAGISRTAVNVMNCFASNLYTDESGQICTWYPVNEMAGLLGVAERTVFKAVGSVKQKGFLKEKKRACYGRCTEYWFMPNGNQPNEKAPTVAAADAEKTGSSLCSSIESRTSDPILPVKGAGLVENGRYLPHVLPHADGGKPVSSDNTISPKQLEELRKSGALSNGI